jgi:DNA polymerase delta subunit 1
MDMDIYDAEPLAVNPRRGFGVPGGRAGHVPVLRMYGVTGAGNSVVAHIHGFTPYFWASPPAGMKEADLPAFKMSLEAALGGSKKGGRFPEAILAVQLLPGKQSLLGYHHGRTQPMLQIYTASPSVVPTAKGVLERGFGFGGSPARAYQCYEANVPFVLRFMIDQGIVGCNWCVCPGGTYAIRPPSRRMTHAQVEVDIVYDSLVSHPPDGAWQRVAPLRILSFDIECMGRKGHFPEADQDPVIQIANVVTVQGASTSIIRNVFTLGSCSAIVGAQVHAYEQESAMLEAWAAFVREADPDIITGYNVQNFDLPYILNRCIKLRTESAQKLGRNREAKATMRDTTFQSSAYGKHENVETTIDGRVTFDMLQYVRRDYKLSSYSLNSVSAHFLGQQKEDVHHSIISDLQRGTPDDRRRLAIYW